MKRKTDNFNKFYNKKNNAAIKEAFRQEKKAAKKERKEAIERHFEEKRKLREERMATTEEIKKLPGKKQPPTTTLKATGANRSAGPAKPVAETPKGAAPGDPNALPLNKYIAHGGLCSRRDAADLIRNGKVEVNGKLVLEPGTKVSPEDFVKVAGKKVTISRNFVYILLNKPKDYITTTDDPQGRKTVLDLIRQATTERVYPVGRLDRNTSGVLLLTNDGDLAQKLAHPRHEIKKIYHVTLDKVLTKGDFDKIVTGVQLEDGLAHVDVLAYADAKDKTQVGLEIHSGRNRIVRRIFEHLGYDVRGLDRVTYAGLTKKNVQRGHWRLLTEKEIRILKYLNASFRGSLSTPKGQPRAEMQMSEADMDDAAFEPPAPKAKDTAAKAAGSAQKFSAPEPEQPKRKPSHNVTGTGYKKPTGKSAPRDKFADDAEGSEPRDRAEGRSKSFPKKSRKPYGKAPHGGGARSGKSRGPKKSFGDQQSESAPHRKSKPYGGGSEHGAAPRKPKPYGGPEHGSDAFGKAKSYGSSDQSGASRKPKPYGSPDYGGGTPSRKAKPYGTYEPGGDAPRKARPYGTSEHGSARKPSGSGKPKSSGSGSSSKKSRRPR